MNNPFSPVDPKTEALVKALMQSGNQMPQVGFGLPAMGGGMPNVGTQPPQQVPFETPESVMAKMFQGVDPMSPQADAIRERAMQQYMDNSPIGRR